MGAAGLDPETGTGRTGGYAPLRQYAAIGDGVATALVASDGSIDWLCLPRHDSPSVFGALLDHVRGGCFRLAPDAPYEVERRYVPDTNVLETTYRTADGVVRVTDAMTMEGGDRLPWRELVRRVEGVAGSVPMRWEVRPRFDYGRAAPDVVRRGGVPELSGAHGTLAVLARDGGEVEDGRGFVAGCFETSVGSRSLIAIVFVDRGPMHLPSPAALERRLESTIEGWRRLVARHRYDGPWGEAVVRSLLAIMLLVDVETGAIVAAPTTSLPERIGGSRNYDYRFAWPRDSSFTMLALMNLGFEQVAHASLRWLLHTLERTHPRIQPIYELGGAVLEAERELDLDGYRGSRPVREGNAAAGQLQLGVYGDVLDTVWMYVREGNVLDRRSGVQVGENADHLCRLWRAADSGFWELPEQRQHTHSKVACWTALRRALDLAEVGQAPSGSVDRWRRTADEIGRFVEERCWSEKRGSYVKHAGGESLDATALLMLRSPYVEEARPRDLATVEAIRGDLGRGPLLYRYSGMEHEEGAFVACSFWLVEALARAGKLEEAAALMDDVLRLRNDVGLLAEEIDPDTGEFLGNFPQGLSHLALVNAAVVIANAAGRS